MGVILKRNLLKILLIGGLAVTGLLIFSGQGVFIDPNQKAAVKKALADFNKAPDFTLTTIEDSTYQLSKLQGNVVLINFWATWCGPCRMEIPEFNELYKNYHEQGLEILGISVSDTKKQLENFIKSFTMDYPILYGPAKEMNDVTRNYGGVYAIPSSFLIGKGGDIIWSYPGAILKNYDPQLFASLVYEIEKALKEEF